MENLIKMDDLGVPLFLETPHIHLSLNLNKVQFIAAAKCFGHFPSFNEK